jgi:thioredoxin-related protein
MLKTFAILVSCCFSLGLAAADAKWHTDLPEAQALARKEKKLVFMDFTGSDWCGWCMKLKQEVFSTPEFNNYARTNLVLVEVDLPRFKPMSPEVLAKNAKLQEQYRAEGFPTIVVLDAAGHEVWRLGGYAEAKPAQWIMTLEALRAKAGLATAPKPPAPAPAPTKKA